MTNNILIDITKIHGISSEKVQDLTEEQDVSTLDGAKAVGTSNYTVKAKSSIEIYRVDTPIIPETRRSLEIFNDGRANEITATFYWSHSFTSKWFPEGSLTVKRGDSGILKAPGNSFYYSKYIIENKTDVTANFTARLV
ncbi:hypothetical protein ACR2Q2_20215 [Pectobacterium versatile]|uniref:hypothetical protein n=1 Tax=Pectobacterium versatile TaxID=2488639 RepID=UPI000D1A70A1|nr:MULTISPECIES: hypothetical protein [Pectobacterium]AVT57609.1 hypothetical protein OA04_09840 [Pectobacterium versatile]MBQ4788404.1 hypothetical protein [Pectobacterium versatile]MCL6332872.1 hypothetical protein [Pectobacterium carotovorum subsp. carotovorum]MCL6345908.1 hypothetical protein [Pectobacterium carotovorum subsp. carotovorum]MCL6400330.1 hypothetical protein [Pectobacterium carotovorum subsp. carotovorum]